jgi:hypothetical protein
MHCLRETMGTNSTSIDAAPPPEGVAPARPVAFLDNDRADDVALKLADLAALEPRSLHT